MTSDRSAMAGNLDSLASRIGKLMWEAEELFGENPHGTYPTEVEMTLRLAWLSCCRAAKQAKEPPISIALGEGQR